MAQGEYVMFADSDDWISCDYVEFMVHKMESEDDDIVYCDYFESYDNNEKLINQNYGIDNVECIRSMLEGGLHGSTWNKNISEVFPLKVQTKICKGG